MIILLRFRVFRWCFKFFYTANVIILYQNGMKQEENCDMIGMKKVQMRYRQTPVGQTEHRAEKMGVQK